MYLACRSTGDNVIKYAFDGKQAAKRVAECFSLANDETFFLRESLRETPPSFNIIFLISQTFSRVSQSFRQISFLHPPLPRINSLPLRCFNVSSSLAQHKPRISSLSYKCSLQHSACSQFTFAGLTDHMKPLSV